MDISFFETKPNIDDIDFYSSYYKELKYFEIESMPNIIFHGNKGSGKTTKIYAYLCSLLDKRVYTLKNNEVELEKRIFKFRSSIYHLEIDCLELINNERIFFCNYLKEYCETRNIGLDMPKIIYIMNIELIHKNSILFLRKLIETNYVSCKFIFETNSISSVPTCISTRFLLFRIRNPSKIEIEKVLKKIIQDKKIKITKNNLNKILNYDINYKNYNDLNSIFTTFNYFLKTNKILSSNNNNIINELVNIITSRNLKFENVQQIKILCEKIFINCYDITNIISSVNKILIEKYKKNVELCYKIVDLSVKCDMNIINSTGKYFIHLEDYFLKLVILLNN